MRLVGNPRILHSGVPFLETANNSTDGWEGVEVPVKLLLTDLHSVQALFMSHALFHFSHTYYRRGKYFLYVVYYL